MKAVFYLTIAAGVATATGLLLGACQRDTDERLGLDEKRGATRFDPASLARYGELEKAVSQPSAEVQKKLGAHRLVQSAHITAATSASANGTASTRPERHDTLDETWRLEVDGQGGARVLHENSHDYGIESIALAGSLYVRPRHGRFVKRAIEGDEADRARDDLEGVLGSYLSLLGRFAERRDEGAVTVAGRAGRKVALSLAPAAQPFLDPDPAHAWRAELKVTALSGEVVVDEASGAPLHAVLDASYQSPRTRTVAEQADTGAAATPATWSQVNEDVKVSIAYRGDVEALGAVPAIAAPDEAVPSPSRPRPMLDRQALLEGLVAAPAAGAPSPSVAADKKAE